MESFESKKALYEKQWGILLKTPSQIEGIRRSCKLAAKILDTLASMTKPGVTTNALNEHAEKLHKEHKAIPAPKGYGEPPFPKSICTSLNEVICHGIPDDTPLQEGDILNIDVTCILDGYYGDCSKMVVVGGKTSPDRQKVVDVSYACLMQAIATVKPGAFISDIGETIEKYASSHDCSVVHQFVGHGVGVDFHEPPQIPHNRNTLKIPLEEGMTFTIEPMINAGVREAVIAADGWTARTRDGKPSAQWEHTLLVTKDGVEILTELK